MGPGLPYLLFAFFSEHAVHLDGNDVFSESLCTLPGVCIWLHKGRLPLRPLGNQIAHEILPSLNEQVFARYWRHRATFSHGIGAHITYYA